MKKFRNDLLFDSTDLISADFDWFASNLHYGIDIVSELSGKVLVVKLGGKQTLRKESIEFVCADLLLLHRLGVKIVVVHGGGGELRKEMEKFDLSPDVVAEHTPVPLKAIEGAQTILRGKIAPSISNTLRSCGVSSICLAGPDCGFITVEKIRPIVRDSILNVQQILDLGMVGEPVGVDTIFLMGFLDKSVVPVVSPIGIDSKGLTYIMNADSCAGFIAKELKAEKLIILCDYEGLANQDGDQVPVLSASECQQMLQLGSLHPKSIYKAGVAADALLGGCGSAHISRGNVAHPILKNLFNQASGTILYS